MKHLAVIALLAAVVPASAAARTAKFNPDPWFPAGPISQTVSHEIPKLDHLATVLAGRTATVNCWSKDDWKRLQAWNGGRHDTRAVEASGITWFSTHHIELNPFLCEVLQQTLSKSANQPLFEAFAVTVFAHESAHASGIKAEGLAECRAMKTEPEAARLFGLSKTDGRRFQHIYRGTIYPIEEAAYRTPSCDAGLPGALVPDTLGSASAVRPLERVDTAIAHTLPTWTNIQGEGSVGPLSPCSIISDRKLEVARFGISLFTSDNNANDRSFSGNLFLQDTRLPSARAFDHALARYHAEPACVLARERTFDRETHAGTTIVSAPAPRAITKLSSEIRIFRERWTKHGQVLFDDTIHIFDRRTLTVPALVFRIPPGKAPLNAEVRALKAALGAMH